MVKISASVRILDDVGSGGVTPLNGPLTEAATFNAIPRAVDSGLPTTELDLLGEKLRGKEVFALGDNVKGTVNWQIDTGTVVTPHKGVITFSFLDSSHATGIYNNPNQGFTEQFGYSSFDAAQRVAGRIAINNWDELITPTFKEVNGSGGADIVMANTSTGPAQAWAYYPYNYTESNYNHLMSDVWIADPFYNGSNAQLKDGQYGLLTINHELGHTLGLSHPGDYNFGDDVDGVPGPDPITYQNDAFYYQDSTQYSIMSYFDSFETGAQPIDWNLMRYVYASTPMVHDIAVIQAKYGADMTTRVGDTTYGFNATADVTNEAMRFHDGEMLTVFSIWDAKGNDTLDLSGYDTPSVIDLRPGAYSSAGGAGHKLTLDEINANNLDAHLGARTDRLYHIYMDGGWSDDGGKTLVNEGESWKAITGTTDQYLMKDNIGIAYGTIVENAIGGGGADRINGNSADNHLTGNGGADTFIFANDKSTDTIMDFHSGEDRIDLTELAITSADVQYNAVDHHLSINTDGIAGYDMTVIVLGNGVNIASDLLF